MNTDCYTRQEKIIHNKFRWRIARDHPSVDEDWLCSEAWAWTYCYLKYLNKPISEWLKNLAQDERTNTGDCVRIIEDSIIDFDKMHSYIQNLRGATAKLKHYGFE